MTPFSFFHQLRDTTSRIEAEALERARRLGRSQQHPQTDLQVKRSMRPHIQHLWAETNFGIFWQQLSAEDRSRLLEEFVDDIRCFERLYAAEQCKLDKVLDPPRAWVERTPVLRPTEGAGAIFRKALSAQLRTALAVSGDVSPVSVRDELAAKLAVVSSEPCSIYYLTQPYLQAIARNVLRNQVRAVARQRPTTSEVAADQQRGRQAEQGDAPQLCAELRHDLAAVFDAEELRIVELLLAEVPIREIAKRLETDLSQLEKRIERIKARFRDHLRRD